ncbi:hypothetical protein A6M14_00670 [Acinetobacter sp. Ac_877]|uniref:PilZ domain-containing protein n=1 Tax=Acinetobacter portensis TaxID=1839785 RepID=UPI00128D4BEF|nr:PilZ domain-containing protein [Acinetobacter portensis]MPW41377.1 hypothetical protein [Acinetobacter portensis]
MEKFQHQSGQNDRRVMSRIDAALRINYQVISEEVALNDPYDSNFVLPRYFLLLAELDQFDLALDHEIEQISEKDQQIARILSLFNQKLNLITGTLYDAIVQSLLPVPANVNISESGISFYSDQALADNSYIHITLSHPENFFHIAAIAQIVHCRQEENGTYRTGAYFISLLPQDRSKLSQALELIKSQQS